MWTDAQILLLIAALLYLSECVVWLPPQAVLLRRTGRGGWKRVRRAVETGVAGRGLVGLPPWPWAVRTVLLPPCAFSASPREVTGFVAARNGPVARPAQPEGVLTLDGAGPVRAVLRDVRVGGTFLARAADDATARAEARRLAALASLPGEAARAAALQKWASDYLDPALAAARLEEVRKAARPVEILALILFAWLFAVVPAVALALGAERVLLPVFLATPLLHLPVAVLFFRAHRRLLPGRRGDAWVEVVKCLLSPPMAARAAESLWLHAFAGFHPMALLLADTTAGDGVRSEARLELADLRYPVFPDDVPEAARECEGWHRANLLTGLQARLRAAGLSGDDPPGSPGPEEARPGFHFCPRCRDSFADSLDACPACGNPPVRFRARRAPARLP